MHFPGDLTGRCAGGMGEGPPIQKINRQKYRTQAVGVTTAEQEARVWGELWWSHTRCSGHLVWGGLWAATQTSQELCFRQRAQPVQRPWCGCVLVSEEPSRPVCVQGTVGMGWAGALSAAVKTQAFTLRLEASWKPKCFRFFWYSRHKYLRKSPRKIHTYFKDILFLTASQYSL